MSFIRYQIDLAFKEPVPIQIQKRLDALESELILLGKYAVVINEGQDNQENTKRISRHICHHDENLLCEPIVELTKLGEIDVNNTSKLSDRAQQATQ